MKEDGKKEEEEKGEKREEIGKAQFTIPGQERAFFHIKASCAREKYEGHFVVDFRMPSSSFLLLLPVVLQGIRPSLSGAPLALLKL